MGVSRRVTLRPVAPFMGLAVHLDRQPSSQACEIDDINGPAEPACGI